jgi:Domain of unknown function (DUF4279)
MSFEHAFATFRVAGAGLHPGAVTRVLGLPPDLQYEKGEKYRRKADGPELTGKTNLWYYSTDKHLSASEPVSHHVLFLLKRIMSNEAGLRELIRESSAHAVLTMFWSGPTGSTVPNVPEELRARLESIPVKVEIDFDTDGEPPTATGTSAIPA